MVADLLVSASTAGVVAVVVVVVSAAKDLVGGPQRDEDQGSRAESRKYMSCIAQTHDTDRGMVAPRVVLLEHCACVESSRARVRVVLCIAIEIKPKKIEKKYTRHWSVGVELSFERRIEVCWGLGMVLRSWFTSVYAYAVCVCVKESERRSNKRTRKRP